MQEVEEVHDTALRLVSAEPAGFGISVIFHVLPFHDSASGTSVPEALEVSPTVIHTFDEAQEIPLRTAGRAPVMFGVTRSFQEMPFHCSANVGPKSKSTGALHPTAMHAAEDERHETPWRMLTLSPPLGVGVIFHFDPFHTSPRVASKAELEGSSPTAVQDFDDLQDTASRPLPVARPPLGTALGWTFQVLPVETSTSGTEVPEWS
jgi:hypothetical protein